MSQKLVELAPAGRSQPPAIDAAGLEQALRRELRSGDLRSSHGDIRFDSASRALYATDGSNYRQIPIGVVYPRDADDVAATVALCRKFQAPLLCRGGGTSLAGQSCNVAVILDFSKHMARILEIDPDRQIARVEPGVILDDLRSAAEKHHLTFGPDPASHNRCTIGGMIGNNSCGVHSVMAGKTDDNIEALEVLTYDGVRLKVAATSPEEQTEIQKQGGRRAEIYRQMGSIAAKYSDLIRGRFPQIPRRVSGYNLNHLLPEHGFNVARSLVGSEGTCATILEATCRLVKSPPSRVLLVIACADIYECADLVPRVLELKPIGLEGFDSLLVHYTRRGGLNAAGLALLPEGGGWLLAEFGDTTIGEASLQAQGLMQSLGRGPHPPKMQLFTDPAQMKPLWEVRESALGATSRVPGEAFKWEGWEDSAVAPEMLGGYLRELRRLLDAHGYQASFYGHFGDGCVHNRIDFDLQSKTGIAKFRKFMEEAADLVVRFGGSISGEHGDGQARGELLEKMFGPELIQAFRDFKSAWDPDWKMNPGKLIDPNKLDHDLRLGSAYAPWQPETHFKFPADHGSLAEATLRCVGVGKCRREEGGLMCPSYRVTREEEHSTRGRAHLLWEMTQGEVIKDQWRSEEVKRSLDLCLACKGCKSECPVGVDVATYKAEFLSHYYQGRARPRSAYAFGLVDVWARLAAHAPSLVNFATRTPGFRDVAKIVAGIPRQRAIPAFAPETFKKWFERRAKAPNNSAPPVLLWPDTFSNHLHPEAAKAAVEVLEAAGFRVLIPQADLCCGRPLYDHGMLDRAKSLLLNILDSLSPEIGAGIPLVVLEPSCAAVFRDELINLYPQDERAHALSRQTLLLGEFLEAHAPNFQPPQFDRKAILHGHCHQKSLMNMTAEQAILRRIGVDFQEPAQGCCGMAGSFGFEREKYAASVAIGELELLPAVRRAPADWLIIADGFSCREQIAQGTSRRAMHLSEVLRSAIQ